MGSPVVNPGQVEDVALRQEIDRIIAERAASGTGHTAPTPIDIEVAGQKFSFENREQLSNGVAALANKYQQDMAAKDAEIAALAARQQAPQTQNQPIPEQFDKAKFADMLVASPVDGMDYAMRFTKTHQDLEQSKAVALNYARQVEVYKFYDNNPDYPQGAARVNADRVVAGIVTQLNLPPTAQGFELAYSLAARKGLVQPNVPQQAPPEYQQQMSQYQPQQNQAPVIDIQSRNAPPVARRGSGYGGDPNADLFEKAEQMDLGDLAKLIGRFNGGR